MGTLDLKISIMSVHTICCLSGSKCCSTGAYGVPIKKGPGFAEACGFGGRLNIVIRKITYRKFFHQRCSTHPGTGGGYCTSVQ
jgi:hypothetical protein